MENKTWVVTGASGGIGAVLVKQLLAGGYRVAALSRTPEKVVEQQGDHAELLTVQVDIRSEESVQKAREKILERYGRVDVVVNTAGYGLWGAIEEISDAEAREIFEVNLFGMLNVCRNFVPDLREQGGGMVINFACMESVIATANHAITNATRFAVDALTDALNKEAGQFGISAICVKSGPMRTEYAAHCRESAVKLEAYEDIRQAAEAAEAEIRGREKADPEKVAALLIRLSGEKEVPKNLYLTGESVEKIRGKWDFLENEFEEWKWATLCVDFPKEECYHGKRS